jgi:hypothetical protein
MLPALDTSAAVSATLTWEELPNVVVLGLLLTLMMVEGTNPVPLTVSAGEVAPSNSAAGEMDVMAGEGLSISRLTGVAALLVEDPFSTITDSCAPLAIWAAGMVAVSWVALT